MNNFKVGDKVIIKNTENVRYWANGGRAIDYVFELSSEDINNYQEKINKNGLFTLCKNKFRINFKEGDFELFIESKFKVGDKFKVDAKQDWITEVVKVSLNKKKGYYSYLCFDTDGYERVLNDSGEGSYSLPVAGQIGLEKKTEELTLAQVCRELGREVKIVK